MPLFLLRRGISAAAVVIVVSVLVFAILQWIPGDPAQIILGINASPDQLENMRAQLGLNLPWYEQYWVWLAHAVQGNLGKSLVFGQPVSQLILERLPVTFSLTVMSLLIAMLIGFPFGVLAAIQRARLPDHVIRLGMQLILGVPAFWIGLLLMSFAALRLQWFPVGGFAGYNYGIGPAMQSLFLPAVSLGVVEAAILGRVVRRSMADVLQAPYMVTVTSKGLPAFRRYVRHGLRTAMIQPITLIGMQVSSLLGGAVVIENLFALPGIGRLLLVAVQQKDLPLLEGLTVFIALVVFVCSFATDLLYRILDPRIQLK